MCGIAGVWDSRNFVQEPTRDLLAMSAALSHRGPDGDGLWTDGNCGIGLVHRRLAVLDVSSAGAQPMVSASGRYVIVFNGEIYNHLTLREELVERGFDNRWRGHSDTETLLACIEAFGLVSVLSKLRGMFAFAVWDRTLRQLTVARDRLGEKPLYIAMHGGALLFASELSALRAHRLFSFSVNRSALRYLIDFGYIGKSHTIYDGVYRVCPGTAVTYSLSHTGEFREEAIEYWSPEAMVVERRGQPFLGTLDDAVDTVESLLDSSVSGQLLTDVPVGALLSGGVDSSLVTAVACRYHTGPLHTFTLGFGDAGFDEAPFAARVARQLQTVHHELYVSSRDALNVIPDIPAIYSEPFADSSQIPTLLVSRLARGSVTVALSGDGGDELFGGYPRYTLARQLWRRLSVLSPQVRRVIAVLLSGIPPAALNAAARVAHPLLPQVLHRAQLGDDLHKGRPLLRAEDFLTMYESILRFSDPHRGLVLETLGQPIVEQSFEHLASRAGSTECQAMLLDLVSYLPNDILAKVDRAAMSSGLETRMPLLDHRLVEFAWTLPDNWRGADGRTKLVLRELLARYIPQSLIERPKMGFSIPVSEWLRGPLRDWAESLLDERRVAAEGYFDHQMLREIWRQHLSGRRDWHYLLWSILMFQGWLQATSPSPR